VIETEIPGHSRPRFATLLALLLAGGCDLDLPGKPDPRNRPVPTDKVLAFDGLFARNCAGCHGREGKLGPAPPLNDPLFRALVPAAALEKTLNHGRSGTPMSPFAHANGGTLTPPQVQVLVHEIKGLPYRIEDKNGKVEIVADPQGTVPAWGVVAPAAASVPSYLVGENAGDAAHGRELFRRTCAGCHGRDGEGVVQDGQRLRKINEQAFLALISDQALRRIIITGRPDLHMPDYAQNTGRPDDFRPLTSAEIADLVALLRAWRLGEEPIPQPRGP
jgi:mono/diheme cytochrome c family protein